MVSVHGSDVGAMLGPGVGIGVGVGVGNGSTPAMYRMFSIFPSSIPSKTKRTSFPVLRTALLNVFPSGAGPSTTKAVIHTVR